MKSILFLNKVPPYAGGGAEGVIWHLGKHLAKHGWDVHYLCPMSVAGEPPSIDNVWFHDVPAPSSYLAGRIAFFFLGACPYYRLVRRLEPDIVYDNMSPFPFIPAHIGPRSTRVVTKVHGIEGLSALRNKPHLITKVGSLLGYGILRFKSGERILSVSDSCAEQIQRRVHNPNEVTVIENGIKTAQFDPEFSPDGPVLALCLMTPKKGIQTLLRAWKQLESRGINRNLIIAGSGPSIEKFKNLADELELERVDFLGYISKNKKFELYSKAYAYVLPTRAEGLVLTNLEAMASKCLVISTSVDGVRDYLSHGVNGLSVKPESPDALAQVLQRAIENPGSHQNLAEEGYRTVTERYELADALNREREYLEAVLD